MGQISTFFWQMCLLRRSPADLPSSNFVTGIIFGLYLAIALLVVNLTRPWQGTLEIITTIAIGISLQAFITYILLQFKRLGYRFRATWSALLGTNGIMLIVLLPFNMILLHSDSDSLKMFADTATWVCLGWWLAIAGHIYHKASDVSVLQGSAIAFLIELLGVLVAVSVFPPPAAQ